jgi:hypothetical protein
MMVTATLENHAIVYVIIPFSISFVMFLDRCVLQLLFLRIVLDLDKENTIKLERHNLLFLSSVIVIKSHTLSISTMQGHIAALFQF